MKVLKAPKSHLMLRTCVLEEYVWWQQRKKTGRVRRMFLEEVTPELCSKGGVGVSQGNRGAGESR